MPETVLITGGSGFIGSAVVRHLTAFHADRFRVVALGETPVESVQNLVVRRDGQGRYLGLADALSNARLGTIDHVIHAGAFMPKAALEIDNIDGNTSSIYNTISLAHALENMPKQFILLSSVDVYGNVPGGADEKNIPNPESLYGNSKLYCERVLSSIFRKPEYSDCFLQIIRVGHTYGPGEGRFKKFIPVTIDRLLRGEPPVLMTNGTERRAFLFIEDCARMIVAALDLAPGNPIINLASANAVSISAIADILSDIVADLTGCRLSPERQGTGVGIDAVFDVTLMQRLFGPERTALVDGLRQEVTAMLAQA